MKANLLTPKQAAKKIGVSTRTLRRWKSKGIVNPVPTSNGKVVYNPNDVSKLKGQKFNPLPPSPDSNITHKELPSVPLTTQTPPKAVNIPAPPLSSLQHPIISQHTTPLPDSDDLVQKITPPKPVAKEVVTKATETTPQPQPSSAAIEPIPTILPKLTKSSQINPATIESKKIEKPTIDPKPTKKDQKLPEKKLIKSPKKTKIDKNAWAIASIFGILLFLIGGWFVFSKAFQNPTSINSQATFGNSNDQNSQTSTSIDSTASQTTTSTDQFPTNSNDIIIGNRLRLNPQTPPSFPKAGDQYFNSSTNSMQYYDGTTWIDLSDSTASSAITLQKAYEGGRVIETTKGDLSFIMAENSSGDGDFLIQLDGNDSEFVVSGGADQDLLTINDDALYPIDISQSTRIAGSLFANKLIDTQSGSYYIDPASTTIAAALSGGVSLGGGITFTQNGEYINNTADNYLTSSAGFSVGGDTTYFFDTDGHINANQLTISGTLDANGQVDLGDGGEDVNVSANNLHLAATGTIEIKPSNDSDDYIYLTTVSSSPAIYFEGASSTNDPGIRINSASEEIEYRDEDSATWITLDSLGGVSSVLTDASGIIYLTDTASDFAVGGNSLASPFSIDESTNTVRIGEGSGSNATLSLYASDGDTGSLNYTTSDTFAFTGGAITSDSTFAASGNITGGSLTTTGTTTLNTVAYTWPGADGSSGQVLSTNGSGTLSWSSTSGSDWTIASGVIYPNSATNDLAIGGTTSAAPFFVDAATGNTYVTGTTDLQGSVANSTGNLDLNDNTDVTGSITATVNADFEGTLTSGTANAFVVDASGNVTSGTWTADVVTEAYGGTGQSSYTIGDLLFADGATSLAKLADIATGNVLLSGGVATAPSWGKVTLGTHTTGNYVSTIVETANQISASATTGDVTLTIPSDFRAPGTVNAISGLFTGATAGTERITAAGNIINIGDFTSTGTTSFNTVTYTWPGSDGSSGQVLSTDSGGNLSWTSVLSDSLSTGGWEHGDHFLYPDEYWVDDLVIGGTSTASATFQVTASGDMIVTGTSDLQGAIANSTGNIDLNDNTDVTGSITATVNADFEGTLTSGTANAFVVDASGNVTSGTWTADVVTEGYGGTGQSSYTIGDLLYADGTTSLAKLADVATGNVLLSGGVGVAPAWGKVTLGTHTTGNYVSTIVQTANQISASATTGDVTLTIPSDFRAPGTVNAVNGLFTGATAGTERITAAGNIVNIGDFTSTGTTSFNTVAYTWPGSDGSNGQVLSTDSGGNLSWASVISDSLSVGGWEHIDHALHPDQYWADDLIIGGNSTASATFQVTAAGDMIVTGTSDLQGNISDSLGNLTLDDAVDVTGALDVVGTTTLNGSVTLGDATSDDIVFTGYVASNILPKTDDTYDLGSDSLRWQDLYLGPQTLHIGTNTTDEATIGYATTGNTFDFTNNYGDTNFSSSSDGFNFTLGGGVGDDFIIDTDSFLVESDTGNIGIGDITPNHKLDIEGAVVGMALMSLNETGDQDIFTASASGATRFRIGTDGYTYAQRFVDIANSIYYVDPADSVTSLLTAGSVGIGDLTPDALLDYDFTSASTTAATEYGSFFTTTDTGIVTTGTDTTYGNYNQVARTGATGGTMDTYGGYIDLTTDNAGAGTHTAIGLSVNLDGNADINYAALFNGGNVGIGTAAPTASLHIVSPATSDDGLIIDTTNQTGGDGLFIEADSSVSRAINVERGGVAAFGLDKWGTVWTNEFRMLQSGSASDVVFGWNGDGDTGIFRSGTNALGLSTGGTERISIDSNGNIGIGDTTPDHKLDIEGYYAGNALVSLNETGSNDIFTASASGTTRFVIANDGNVGIGTTSPDEKIHINGNIIAEWAGNATTLDLINWSATDTIRSQLSFEKSGSGTIDTHTATVNNERLGDIYFRGNSGSAFTNAASVSVYQDGAAGTYTPGELRFAVSSGSSDIATKMIIRADGNVGIGTNTPETLLDIVGGDLLLSNNQRIDFRNAADSSTIKALSIDSSDRTVLNATGSNNIVFQISQVDKMTLGSSNLNLEDALDLTLKDDSGTAPGDIIFEDDSSNQMGRVWGTGSTLRLSSTDTTADILIDSAGEVGIGITTPGYKLDVRNSLSGQVAQVYNTNTGTSSDGMRIKLGAATPGNNNDYIVFKDGGEGTDGAVDGNGSGGVRFQTTSDARLKTKVIDVDNALSVLMDIRPVYYEMIQAPGIENIGFLAQELQQVYPFAASGSPDGDVHENPMMIDYSQLTPILTAAIQEQQLQIADNSTQLTSLGQNLSFTDAGDLDITQSGLGEYQITKVSDGSLIESISAFSKSVIGTITAGFIQAEEITANSINIQGQALAEYITSIVQQALNSGDIISPISETTIANSDTVTQIKNDIRSVDVQVSTLEVDVSSLNTEFTLNQSERASQSSRIAMLESIQSTQQEELDRLEVSKYDIPTTNTALGELANPTIEGSEPAIDQNRLILDDLVSNYASISALIADSGLRTTDYLASSSAYLAIETLDVDHLNVDMLSVTQMAVVDDNLMFTQSSIQTLANDTLFIQPVGGSINLAAGLMILDADGQSVTINGDLTVGGRLVASNIDVSDDLNVKGVITANTIKSDFGQILDIRIATESALAIYKDLEDSPSATIDASGSATFNRLALPHSTGNITFFSGDQNLNISVDDIAPESQVFITFSGDYSPATKYWVTTDWRENTFTIHLNYPVESPVDISWMIIN